ncbi:MAG: lipoate--protein ligase [Desulfovibrio sp.]|nr:lipoate--protein ligase [Desulfovibrio sp.]
MLLLEFESFRPSFNLALEETLLNTLPPASPGLFILWQNDPAIIVGRHQDARAETAEVALRRLNIPVYRRISGGGAVYHDHGTLNYSFIRGGGGFPDFRSALEPVRSALAELGIDARIGGRNDLEADGLKIGGAASAVRGDKVLLHGCLLWDVDPERLAALLTPSPAKTNKRRAASVASRVGSLKNFRPALALEDLKIALTRRCSRGVGEISPEATEAARKLEKSRYLSSAWNWRPSKRGQIRKISAFPWGITEIAWSLRNGKITNPAISGDFFSRRDIGELELALTGRRPTELPELLARLPLGEFFDGCDPVAAAAFIAGDEEP